MEEMRKLGRYLLIEQIASGGMATVHKAKLVGAAGFEKIVAVKEILPHWSKDPEFVNMLIDEAKVLVHLTHANLVQVFELCQEDHQYFIVMEFVEGFNLRTLIKKLNSKKEKIPVELACFIIREILKGLDFAHSQKSRDGKALDIVHRDISPQNILLSLYGEVKVTDFGIARVKGKAQETQVGTLKGKFAYMSPEQALGRPVDARCDIFAVGILLYEMITGERLFKGNTDLETLESVRQAQINISEELNLSPNLKTIILKALAKNKENRFQTAGEFIHALDLEKLVDTSGPVHLKNLILKNFDFTIQPSLEAQTQKQRETVMATQIHSKSRETKILVGIEKNNQTQLLAPTVIETIKTVIKKQQHYRFSVDAFMNRPLVYWGSVGVVVVLLVFFLQLILKPAPVAYPLIKVEETKIASEIKPVKTEQKTEIQILNSEFKEEPKPDEKIESVAKLEEKDEKIVSEPEKVVDHSFVSTIKIKTNPASALIELNYLDKKIKNNGVLNLAENFEDKVVVTLKMSSPDYQSITKTIELDQKNPNIEESFSLTPLIYGSVMVNSKPWGRVYLSGVTTGTPTPFSSRKIPVGSHRLTVKFANGRQASTSIRISKDSLIKCTAILSMQATISCH